MKFNSIYYTVPGRRHLSMGKGNEDFVNVYESETVLVYAVADGCSESTCAAPASEATVAAGIEFAMNGDIWAMKQKAMRDEYLRILDKHYLACPYPYEDLAATTVLLVINKVSDKYLAIFLICNADRNTSIQVSGEIQIPNSSSVDAPLIIFQLIDDLAGPDLRCSR